MLNHSKKTVAMVKHSSLPYHCSAQQTDVSLNLTMHLAAQYKAYTAA